jgi:molybdenum cofactor sulfurtransferase
MDGCALGDFDRLHGTTYVDWAGAALYGSSLLDACHSDLKESVAWNPHTADTGLLERARAHVLQYVHASHEDYACVFTSGATHGLKMIAESLPWGARSSFEYTQDNHTSVVGIGAAAAACGASVACVGDPSEVKGSGHGEDGDDGDGGGGDNDGFTLTAFPAESNFNGKCYSLEQVGRIQGLGGRRLVLLDCAKFCATHALDLGGDSGCRPDFVVLSFYKLFGYPTGLGCLLVRTDSAALLSTHTQTQGYYGGGTVEVSIPAQRRVVLKSALCDRLEHGTVNFLGIAALKQGFAFLERLGGPESVHTHTRALTEQLLEGMRGLAHFNGVAVCEVYGHSGVQEGESYGPTVAFSLKTPQDGYVGYAHVTKLARMNQIILRSGCFCNPGACQRALGLTPEEVMAQHENGHSCGDDVDLVGGRPTGCLRVSLGYGSTLEDVQCVVSFLRGYFVVLAPADTPSSSSSSSSSSLATDLKEQRISITNLIVYPIKSCQGFEVTQWPINARGLLYDREFCVVNARNVALTQKAVPAMAKVAVSVDAHAHEMTCTAADPSQPPLVVALGSGSESDKNGNHSSVIHVCGVKARASLFQEPHIAEWFSRCIGQPCTLARIAHPSSSSFSSSSSSSGGIDGKKEAEHVKNDLQIGFNNEGQYLLVSQTSVAHLAAQHNATQGHSPSRRSSSGGGKKITYKRFRPNIVVSGCVRAFEEDAWSGVACDAVVWEVENKCTRCGIINVDPKTGKRVGLPASSGKKEEMKNTTGKPLFATLAKHRAGKAKITFGVLLRTEQLRDGGKDAVVLTVGDTLTVTE